MLLLRVEEESYTNLSVCFPELWLADDEFAFMENGIDPGPKRGKGSWDEFLKIHADTLWQRDFLSKPMWTAKGLVDVYLLVFLHLGSRRVLISPSTV